MVDHIVNREKNFSFQNFIFNSLFFKHTRAWSSRRRRNTLIWYIQNQIFTWWSWINCCYFGISFGKIMPYHILRWRFNYIVIKLIRLKIFGTSLRSYSIAVEELFRLSEICTYFTDLLCLRGWIRQKKNLYIWIDFTQILNTSVECKSLKILFRRFSTNGSLWPIWPILPTI